MRKNYVIALLVLLKGRQQIPLSEVLEHFLGRGQRKLWKGLPSDQFEAEDAIIETINDLENLGFIKFVADGNNDPVISLSGEGGPPDFSDSQGEEEQDDSGSGIAEVLRNKVLLSYPTESFSDLLGAALIRYSDE